MVQSQTPKIRTWGNQRNNSKRVKSTIPQLSIACLGETEVFQYCQSVTLLVAWWGIVVTDLQAQPLSSLGLGLIGPQLHGHWAGLGLIGPVHDMSQFGVYREHAQRTFRCLFLSDLINTINIAISDRCTN